MAFKKHEGLDCNVSQFMILSSVVHDNISLTNAILLPLALHYTTPHMIAYTLKVQNYHDFMNFYEDFYITTCDLQTTKL